MLFVDVVITYNNGGPEMPLSVCMIWYLQVIASLMIKTD
jgi:hypothetical protein